jgi:hypothetical protein
MSTRLAWTLCIAWVITMAPLTAESTWRFGARMNQARAGHTATLLPDGRVLVVGGITDGRVPNTETRIAELYDPQSRTWRMTQPLVTARWLHTATLLPDGRVLVAGGTARRTASEIFDPVTEKWSSAGGPGAGFGHTATLLEDGRVLIAGGLWTDGSLSGNVVFDAATGAWSPTAAPRIARFNHTATLMADGRVLAVGGIEQTNYFEEGGPPIDLAEWYDAKSDRWSVAGSLPEEMMAHTATLLPGGKVLIAGGSARPYVFDPATGVWTAMTLYGPAYSPAAILLPQGKVLFTGGVRGRVNRGPVTGTTQWFDASRDMWTQTHVLQAARGWHTATLLRDGTVLVAGGMSSTREALDSTEELTALSPPKPIDAGFTGSWFDAAQGGQGLMIQILPENRILAAWFSFDFSRAPAWFFGVGSYSGNTAILHAVEQPVGGRWITSSDPGQLVRKKWGTLELTFSDCAHGRVDFTSGPGFGSGTMELARWTVPAGVQCP